MRLSLYLSINRCKYAARVERKLAEINETMERLYQVRHARTGDAQDVLMQTKVNKRSTSLSLSLSLST